MYIAIYAKCNWHLHLMNIAFYDLLLQWHFLTQHNIIYICHYNVSNLANIPIFSKFNFKKMENL